MFRLWAFTGMMAQVSTPRTRLPALFEPPGQLTFPVSSDPTGLDREPLLPRQLWQRSRVADAHHRAAGSCADVRPRLLRAQLRGPASGLSCSRAACLTVASLPMARAGRCLGLAAVSSSWPLGSLSAPMGRPPGWQEVLAPWEYVMTLPKALMASIKVLL